MQTEQTLEYVWRVKCFSCGAWSRAAFSSSEAVRVAKLSGFDSSQRCSECSAMGKRLRNEKGRFVKLHSEKTA